MKLSHFLYDNGFISSIGFQEHPTWAKEAKVLTKGNARDYNSNNGVAIVYDENGLPWVNYTHRTQGGFWKRLKTMAIPNCKVYVPFSNGDGGKLKAVFELLDQE